MWRVVYFSIWFHLCSTQSEKALLDYNGKPLEFVPIPKISSPTDGYTRIGDTVTFHCYANYEPNFTGIRFSKVLGFKKGKSIENSSRIIVSPMTYHRMSFLEAGQIIAHSSLSIFNVTKTDAGLYECRLQGWTKSDVFYKKVKLLNETQTILKITHVVEVVHAANGSNTTISFHYSNYPATFDYEILFKNESLIHHELSKCLPRFSYPVQTCKTTTPNQIHVLLKEIQLAGNYSVVLRNEQLTVNASTYVRLVPIVALSPQDVNTKADEEVFLTCNITNHEGSDVFWKKIGPNQNCSTVDSPYHYEDLKYSKEEEIVDSIVKVVRISATFTKDTTVCCLPSDGWPIYVASAYVKVSIAGQQLKIRQDRPGKVMEEQTLVLSCEAIKMFYKSNLKWMKDGQELNASSAIEMIETNSESFYGSMLIFHAVLLNDSGVYGCQATLHNGTVDTVTLDQLEITGKQNLLGYILLMGSLVVILMSLTVFLCIRYRQEGSVKRFDPNLDVQADQLPYDEKYEFARDKLVLEDFLGDGAFGIVLKGTAHSIQPGEEETTVAIKMVRENSDHETLKALISELKIMMGIEKHLNIVNLLGAVTQNIEPRQMMIIVEYCKHGNLKNYLTDHRDEFVTQIDPETDTILNDLPSGQQISTLDLIYWSYQVARGMNYLAMRKVLHGDLAARNVLLTDRNIVKVCDFGLARSLYRDPQYLKQSNIPMPIKWLAIESLHDLIFSTMSDVWAFGVTVWEIFSLAEMPYAGIDCAQIMKMLDEGYRMECPPFATQQLYKIMRKCWHKTPEERWTFEELEDRFRELLPESYFLNEFIEESKAKDEVEYSSIINPGHIEPPTSDEFELQIIQELKQKLRMQDVDN